MSVRDPIAASRRTSLVVWGAFVVLVVGCSGARQAEEDSEQSESEIVGAPPSESDDPFRVAETPETAERAESTGYLGEERSEEDAEDANSSGDPSSASGELAVRASEAEPSEEKPELESTSEIRCFSCVRICPIDESGGSDCEGGERDVICGWGVHEKSETAQKLARAECNGALDMARQMQEWSRIEGECPPAECRSR